MYTPAQVPTDPAAIPQYLDGELRALSLAISSRQPYAYLQTQNVVPAKPQEGQVYKADGTNWNPGSGAGFYGYVNGAWVFFGGGSTANPNRNGLSDLGTTWKSITGIHTYGDSYTFLTPGYSAELAVRVGLTQTNHGVSGDQVADQSELSHAVSVAESDFNTILVGINDARQYGGAAAYLAFYKSCLQDLIAWNSIPNVWKVLARNALITYSGTWTNDASNGNIAKKSSTAGDTASFAFYGETLYVGYRAVNSNTSSSFTLKIDGVLYGTYTCDPGVAITTQNAQTYGSQLVRVKGLTNTDHTALVTVVGGGGTVYLEWVCALTGSVPYTWPRCVVSAIPHIVDYTIPPANGSNAIVDQYNDKLLACVEELSSDGLHCGYVDPARIWNVVLDIGGDGVHPTLAGYTIIADKFFEGWTNFGTYAEVDIAFNSTWAAYAAGFECRARLMNNILYLHGVAKRNASGSTLIGTLPAGFLPMGQDRYVACVVDAGTGTVGAKVLKVGTAGDLVISTGLPADNVSLDGISIPITKSLA